MPKPHTFPTLFDEVQQLNIKKLKEWNYFEPESIKAGTLTWSVNGQKTGSISIEVNNFENYIELFYKFRGEPINYKIYFVDIESNLGKGSIRYFQCPKTNKLCRILYSVGAYFYHRTAFKDAMYQTQTFSKKGRYLVSLSDAIHKNQKIRFSINDKHYRKFYAGKMTKRYKRYLLELEKGKQLDKIRIEDLLFM